MKCGLDIGTSLVKAAVLEDSGAWHFFSTREQTAYDLGKKLEDMGVKKVVLTGVGIESYDFPFDVENKILDPIENEIKFQGRGMKQVLKWEGISDENFLLIGMGTGTSYTSVYKDNIINMPFGSFIGGGFLAGMSSQIIGWEQTPTIEERFRDMNDLAESVIGDNRADILMQDQMKALEGTAPGQMLIASCGKLDSNSNMEDACFGLVNLVAASTMKDILVYKHLGMIETNQLVFSGTTIHTLPVLQKLFTLYGSFFDFTVSVPHHGEFAGAIGALLSLE